MLPQALPRKFVSQTGVAEAFAEVSLRLLLGSAGVLWLSELFPSNDPMLVALWPVGFNKERS